MFCYSFGHDFCCYIFNYADSKCKIIFDEATNTSVANLFIHGEFEALSDLSDAVSKFNNLKSLQLKGKLKVVERSKFAAFNRIDLLNLNDNEITELASDNFDDLTALSRLILQHNNLKEIHRDVFHELHNLKSIYLGHNQLEILPERLFRSNQKLKEIKLEGNKIKVLHPDVFQKLHSLQSINLSNNQLEILPDGLFQDNQNLYAIYLGGNKIRTIECNFHNLPSLITIGLTKNICIDENCVVSLFCGTNSISEMHRKINDKCGKTVQSISV